jgi:3-hydroxyisobutyrate dehydrogenase
MKIGFIDLGNVGSKLNGSLIRNGYDVMVLDLNPDLMAQKSRYGRKGSK